MSIKTNKKRIPLYNLKLSSRTRRLVTATIDSGWLSTGPNINKFEKEVAAYLKVPYAAAVNSCTVGLQLMLKAFGIGKGSEVLTTPFTFVATVQSILNAGAHPVFVDIDPRTLNIDTEKISRKIKNKSRAVLSVDIAGYPADYDRLKKICREHKLYLLSDAAHAFGAKYRQRFIPQLTDAAVFSFHATKNLTCGEGGMVVSRHKKVIKKIKKLSLHGLSTSAYERKLKKNKFYDVKDLGLKANMSELHAAIGLGQLTVFDKEQDKRKKLVERYLKNLSGYEDYFELPPVDKKRHPSWHLFIIKLHLKHLKIDRDRFIAKMSEKNIECGVHFKPIFELSYYRNLLGLSDKNFPNATYAGRRVVSLPLYPELTYSQVDYICDCLADILSEHSR